MEKSSPPCEYCIEVRLLGCAGMCKGFHAYASKLKKPKQSRLEHIKWTKRKSRNVYAYDYTRQKAGEISDTNQRRFSRSCTW